MLVWLNFLIHFKGKALWQEEFCLFTDSAGSVGFGAIWNTHWCFAPWPADWVSRGFCTNIVLLELFPLIVASKIWGEQFVNRRILVSTDNKGVLFAVNCLSSKSQPVYLCFATWYINVFV